MLVDEAVGGGRVGVNVSVGGMGVGGTAVSVGAATSSAVDVASTAGAFVGADEGTLHAARIRIKVKVRTGCIFIIKSFSIP